MTLREKTFENFEGKGGNDFPKMFSTFSTFLPSFKLYLYSENSLNILV